jgi:hypothetical protein
MRDSDVAIGALVLLGIIGALIYFLVPKFISDVLRGPSYATIIKTQQNGIGVRQTLWNWGQANFIAILLFRQ